ncbi:MAG: cysteine-rich CWC family protein [Candidatus Omnitrophica bacterium]|nr:cysteine-rich CWC family protein [Candidatus Omnitrophota bacterium]
MGKKKKCPRCLGEFSCQDESPMPCWCSQSSLSKEVLTRLAEQYSDCLCPSCLSSYAQR